MGDTSIEGFREWLSSTDRSYLTIKNYTSQINKFYATHENIEGFPQYLKDNNNLLRRYAIMTYLKFLKENGQDTEPIIALIRQIRIIKQERKRMATLEIGNGIKLIQSLTKKKKDKMALICMICYDTGVRVRAVLKLKRNDIEIQGKKTYLGLTDKRSKFKIRLITDSTGRRLGRYIAKNNIGLKDNVFFGRSGITDTDLDNAYANIKQQLDRHTLTLFGEVMGFHWMRRGSGVDIYEQTGHNLLATQEFLDHENVEQTITYLKLKGKDAERVIAKKKRNW